MVLVCQQLPGQTEEERPSQFLVWSWEIVWRPTLYIWSDLQTLMLWTKECWAEKRRSKIFFYNKTDHSGQTDWSKHVSILQTMSLIKAPWRIITSTNLVLIMTKLSSFDGQTAGTSGKYLRCARDGTGRPTVFLLIYIRQSTRSSVRA